MAGHHPTIAFLLDMLYEDYAIEAWKGAIEAGRRFGTRILAFTGGNLKREDSENRLRNAIYGFVGPSCADAVVSLSASLANTVGTEAVLEFCRRFDPLPVVHVGIEAKARRWFRVDGYSSSRKAVEHLIDVHGRRKIAYIRGPADVKDADDRYQGYLDALAGRGAEADPELVYVGDFYREAGERAVLAIMDERKKSFDALVSANDYMAVYAIRALRNRGIRVPEDVAVFGFDDIDVSRDCFPPLSTIRQPIREILKIAVEAAARAAENGERGDGRNPVTGIVPAELVLRRSCGCSGSAPDEEDPCPDAEFSRWAEAYVAEGSYEQACAFLDYAEGSGESFPPIYARVQASVEGAGIDCETARHALSTLVRVDAERRSARERMRRSEDEQIQRMAGELAGSVGEGRLGSALEGVLKRAGISFYLVAEYEEGTGSARVVKSSAKGAEGVRFDSARIAPEGLGEFEDNRSLVVLPLYVGEQRLGHLVADALPDRPIILELLREHLSAAIMALRAERTTKERETRLEELVRERTEALEKAFREIEAAKERIERISIMDEYSGVLNRRGFLMMAERGLAELKRTNGCLALAFVDVDGLKRVNDRFSHAEGDWLIAAAARVLKGSFRTTDVIGRVGGDEFLVFAPDCGTVDLGKARERLERRIGALNTGSGKPYDLSISSGTAVWEDASRVSLEDIIAKADGLLYEEKARKKGA